MSTHFAEIPKLLDEINHNCRSTTLAYSKATNNMILWVSLDGIFISVALLTCLSPISAKPPVEIWQQSKPQLCPSFVCRWQPFTRYRLLFPLSSPINMHRSLYTACHINTCFVNVVHKSFCSNRNGNYCGYKDNYSLMAASSNSQARIGLLLWNW